MKADVVPSHVLALSQQLTSLVDDGEAHGAAKGIKQRCHSLVSCPCRQCGPLKDPRVLYDYTQESPRR